MKKVLVGLAVAMLLVGFFTAFETTYEEIASHTVSIEDVKSVAISGTLSDMQIEGETVSVSGSKENSLFLAKDRGINTIKVSKTKNVFGSVKYQVASVQ